MKVYLVLSWLDYSSSSEDVVVGVFAKKASAEEFLVQYEKSHRYHNLLILEKNVD